MKPCCNFCKNSKKEFSYPTVQCEFLKENGYGSQVQYIDWMRGPCPFYKKDPLKNMYGITDDDYIREYLFAMLCRLSIDSRCDDSNSYEMRFYPYGHQYNKYNSYLRYHKREATKPKCEKKNGI